MVCYINGLTMQDQFLELTNPWLKANRADYSIRTFKQLKSLPALAIKLTSTHLANPIDQIFNTWFDSQAWSQRLGCLYRASTSMKTTFFDIYQGAQVILQPITLFYMNHYPLQQLELFCQFVQSFKNSKPTDVLPYIREMRWLRIWIKEHLKNSLAMPPFFFISSCKEMAKWVGWGEFPLARRCG